MSKAYHVRIENEAWHRAIERLLFEIDSKRIRWTGHLSSGSEREYPILERTPYYMVINLEPNGIRLHWNHVEYKGDHKILSYDRTETVVREHLKSLDDTMVVAGHKICFLVGGWIRVDCCAEVSFEDLEKLYQRAKARREEG